MEFPDNSKPEVGSSKYKLSPEQQRRLDLLKTAVNIFEKNNIRYAVAGGYGLDGLRGELTRDHKDIDLIIDSKDIENARVTLGAVGFRRQKDKPTGVEVYIHDLSKTKLEIGSLELVRKFFQGDEDIILPKVANGSLEGLAFRVATLEGQQIIRDIQSKRFGTKAPNSEHDERIIKDLKSKL
jgi:hypothetical protein